MRAFNQKGPALLVENYEKIQKIITKIPWDFCTLKNRVQKSLLRGKTRKIVDFLST